MKKANANVVRVSKYYPNRVIMEVSKPYEVYGSIKENTQLPKTTRIMQSWTRSRTNLR